MLNNIFLSLRNRVKSVIALVFVSMSLFACGAAMTFYLAPTQAIHASQVSKMPMMDARFVSDAKTGSEVLITGYLTGNPTREQPEFIAYTKDEWDVTASDDDDSNSTPSGSWTNAQTVALDLTLEMDGAPVQIHANNSASLSGQLHEKIMDGNGLLEAAYGSQNLHDGAQRYRGFANGDLSTIFGKTASVGGVLPDEIFAGDRVAFEKYQHQLTFGYLIGGIAFMLCSPLVLVIGILAALFGRKK